jgi:TonB family protein
MRVSITGAGTPATLLSITALLGSYHTRGAETAPAPPPTEEAVPIEVFKAPAMRHWAGASYPHTELGNENEGWVHLSMKIDPAGKPYEVTVVDSLGGAPFERAAIAAAQRSTYEPATHGNSPVHSGYDLKMRFAIRDLAKGADPGFVDNYRRLVKAIQDGDRERSDKLLQYLPATNLYEDAYRNFALYLYYVNWGNDEQRLAALNGALACEGEDPYLDKSTYSSALQAMLVMQIERRRLGDAMETWRVLSRIAPETQLDPLRPVMERITQLQKGHQLIRTPGEIIKGTSWFTKMFRRQFEIVVLSGEVSEIKLRCEKSYVFFRHEAGLRYTVSERDGQCSMQVIGDPGTKFELRQT